MRIKPKQIKVTVPVIMEFNDYHDIDYVLDFFNELFGGKMKAEELGCLGQYHAVFFLKKDQEFRALVKEWKEAYKDELDYES